MEQFSDLIEEQESFAEEPSPTQEMLQNIAANYNENTPENERNDEDEDLFKLSQFLTKRNEIN